MTQEKEALIVAKESRALTFLMPESRLAEPSRTTGLTWGDEDDLTSTSRAVR